MCTFENTMAMKRLTIAILALVCALTVNAELTLENIITGARIDPYDKQDTSAVVAFPTHEGVMYIQRDFDRNYKTVIRIYDQSVNLRAEIPMNAYMDWCEMKYPSTHLFNTDDKVEFLFGHAIYNEDGEIIQSFDDLMDNAEVVFSPTGNRLVVRYNAYSLMFQPKTEIYALPSKGCPCCLEYADLNVTTNEADAGGNNSGGNTTTGTTRASAEMPVAYPVPATSVVVLPYFLKQGEETTMMIYDQTGKLVEQRDISYVSNELSLDVTKYAPGSYVYKYANLSGKFVVK